jgi:hypothetical protein
VYFIDCDAMRINGVSVLPQVETPGWQARAGEELATVYTDTYKLGLLALRLLAGDHDTKNLAHLPATTPEMLRQIITDTLTNQLHQRPLPDAWTYMLGHAIEQAQHRQKAAAAAPVSVAPGAPSTPVVHSRPSSRPPAPPPPPPPPRAADRVAPEQFEPISRRRRSPHWVGIALLIIVIAAILTNVAKNSYFRWRSSHSSQTATAQTTPPSAPTAQPAPPAQPTAQPAPPPPPASAPTEQYVTTPWGTRCQVSTDEIICDTCEPGLVLDTPAGADCPGPSLNEIAVDSSGTSQSPAAGAILPASPSIQQLAEGETYHVNGWTITVSGWVRFTNDATGHGIAVAAQNHDFF